MWINIKKLKHYVLYSIALFAQVSSKAFVNGPVGVNVPAWNCDTSEVKIRKLDYTKTKTCEREIPESLKKNYAQILVDRDFIDVTVTRCKFRRKRKIFHCGRFY